MQTKKLLWLEFFFSSARTVFAYFEVTPHLTIVSLRKMTVERGGQQSVNLCVTNKTGLSLACFFRDLHLTVFWSCTKRSVAVKVKFNERFFQTKCLLHPLRKVCHLLIPLQPCCVGTLMATFPIFPPKVSERRTQQSL